MFKNTGDLAQRSWSKVAIVEDEHSCWEWRAARRRVTGEDYGQFRWTPPGKEKSEVMSAHRVAYYLSHGYLPNVGCHTCDNPPCCRPDHIYDGTHKTNGEDKARRGRGRTTPQRGEDNVTAVLTDAIVIDARRRSKDGETQQALADEHGVSRDVLGYAIRGETWSHLDETEAPYARRVGGGSRLTDDDVRAIRAAYASAPGRKARGDVTRTLAEDHGITAANVYAIVRRKSWKHVE